jgi:hypothetical protein
MALQATLVYRSSPIKRTAVTARQRLSQWPFAWGLSGSLIYPGVETGWLASQRLKEAVIDEYSGWKMKWKQAGSRLSD